MFEDAIAALRKARAMNESWFTLSGLGYAYAKAGQRQEAQKVLAELQERGRREPVLGILAGHRPCGARGEG
jgi:Flp pilus assembly protein TadD